MSGKVTNRALSRVLLAVAMAASTLLVLGVALASGTFTDDNGNIHEAAIEAIATEGITKGCNPPTNNLYCPDGSVTRGQMAAFLRRAFNLPSSSIDIFVDDDNSVFGGDINAVAEAGITKGCNPPANDRFCPDGNVTRGQMAAFLRRAFDYPAASFDYFVDDDSSIFESEINAIAAAGVTVGCNPPTSDRYCPTDLVKRDQMASFLTRALGLTPIIPPPPPTTPSTLCRAQSSIPVVECEALVSFYNATHGPAWFQNTGWLTETNPCDWHGVTCNGGAVTDLGFLDNGLSGVIPAELGNLTNLTSLDLSLNRLSGVIPAELGNLTNLTRLVLYASRLSGAIPAELGNLTNLTYLDLGNNELSGPVPPELQNLTNINDLWLRGQSGCLTATDPAFADWLTDLDTNWNDGCPAS